MTKPPGGATIACVMNILVAVPEEQTGREDLLDIARSAGNVVSALRSAGYHAEPFLLREEEFRRPALVADRLLARRPDGIFNLFEGFGGSPGLEADFAELLEERGIPYTGSPPQALRTCLDKAAAREVLLAAGVPVPGGAAVSVEKDGLPLERAAAVARELRFPLFLKPSREDGNVGIDEDSLVADPAALRSAVERKSRSLQGSGGGLLLIEEFVDGPEYAAAFLGDPPYRPLPVTVLDYRRHPDHPPFLTYRAKWHEDDPSYRELMPRIAGLPEDGGDPILRRVLDTAAAAGRALGCRSYFRVDLRDHDGTPRVLDVNPNPGINTDSGLARQAAAAGLPYSALIVTILEETIHRGRRSRGIGPEE